MRIAQPTPLPSPLLQTQRPFSPFPDLPFSPSFFPGLCERLNRSCRPEPFFHRKAPGLRKFLDVPGFSRPIVDAETLRSRFPLATPPHTQDLSESPDWNASPKRKRGPTPPRPSLALRASLRTRTHNAETIPINGRNVRSLDSPHRSRPRRERQLGEFPMVTTPHTPTPLVKHASAGMNSPAHPRRHRPRLGSNRPAEA